MSAVSIGPRRTVAGVVSAGRETLPSGWGDLARQVAIWFGFLAAYQLVRGVAGHDPNRAFRNGWHVLGFEQRTTHHLFELTAQRIADSSHVLLTAAAWTYWNSEFTVLGLALLWVYLRRHDRFARFRNTVLLANTIGLVGYLLWPTAPPRLFQSLGFQDTLDRVAGINHGSGLISLAANPYAAMPSLHAADALIVAATLVAASRHLWTKTIWVLWPGWVWFCLVATANHSLLDVLAGIVVAGAALAVTHVCVRLRRVDTNGVLLARCDRRR